MTQTRYIPVPKFGEYYPYPTASEWYNIQHSSKRDERVKQVAPNGRRELLSKALVKAGKSLLVDEQEFLRIMAEIKQGGLA